MCKKIILLLIFLISACQQKPSYTDLNGNVIRIEDFHHKWLIINYWANWCKPCFDEVPELNTFNEAHASKDAVILGVSFDEANIDELKKWVKKLGIRYTVLTKDPAKELGLDSITGIPTSVVISPEGQIKKILFGPQTSRSLSEAIGQG